MRLVVLILAVAALLLPVVPPSFADLPLPPFKHSHLNVFPATTVAKGKTGLRVDGNLTDWKPEAFLQLAADPDLMEFYSCRAAFAYDASGLLLAFQFTDRSPMVNKVNPAVDPFKGWSGDALQLRLVTDPSLAQPIPADKLNSDAILHLTMWFYSDGGFPVLDLRRGMDFHGARTLTGKDSGLIYQKAPGGYVLEGKIPWAMFGVSAAPVPGARWITTLQPLWGDAEGKIIHNFFDILRAAGFQYQSPNGWGYADFVKPTEVKTRLAAQAAEDRRLFAIGPVGGSGLKAGIPVKYSIPAKGFVSLALCTPNGQIVRTLLAKVERKAGALIETWDGLDDDGKPVPPGEYVVKALTHPGIKPRFVCSVMNSGNPPWGNSGGMYGWGGDHGEPIGAASDPEGNTYLLWTFNEGGDYLIKVDAAGQKQWGARISWGDFDGGATSLVYDHGLVYTVKDGSGKDATCHGGLFVYEAKTGRRTNFPDGRGVMPVSDWPKSLLDAVQDTGTPAERMKAGRYTPADTGANIVAIAASPDRLFCSLYLENKVIALDKKTFQVAETYPLPRPAGLAYSREKNLLYAVSRETVVALDPAQGCKVTPLIATGLEHPYGLALDAKGALWVSVRGRQMQVLGFRTDDFGASPRSIGASGGRPWQGKFNSNGMLLPAGISVDAQGKLWVAEKDSTPKRVSLWDTADAKLVKDFYGSAAYAPMMAPDPERPEEVYIHNCRFIVDYDEGTVTPDATVYRSGYDGPGIPGSEQGYGWMGATFELSRFGGKTFAFNGHGGVFAVEKERFKPLLYIGQHFAGLPPLIPPDYPWNAGVVWTDTNRDGLWTEAELRKVSGLPFDNNIGQFGGTFFPGAAFIKGKRLYRPTGLTPEGVPVYPKPEDASVLGCEGVKPFQNWLDIWPSVQSDWRDFYLIASERGTCQEGDGRAGVFRFTQNGEMKWRYSRVAVAFALKAPLAKTGDLYGALRIAGQAQMPKENGGEILGIGCYRGYFGFLSEDGLFIDQVGYDNGRGPSTSFDTFFIENFSGYFFKHPKTGKVYLFCGDVDGRILELQGWDRIRRFDAGEVTVTRAQYEAAVAAAASASSGSGAKPPLVVVSATPRLDGSFKGWEKSRPAKLELDETRKSAISLAYDAKSLYALFKVPDASPWRNSSKDWHFLFKGGDAVDLQLGVVNPAVDGSKRKAQRGDVRVIVAPTEDGTGFQAVAMWPQVLPGMKPDPQLYKSPVGEERFDRVALLTTAACRATRTATGYTVEVALPWEELGMSAPARSSQMQGDVGVLQSDGAGLQTVLRRYLFNPDTGVVNDIPSEVRVNSGNWGTWVFE